MVGGSGWHEICLCSDLESNFPSCDVERWIINYSVSMFVLANEMLIEMFADTILKLFANFYTKPGA